jgi:hypothetical protein
MQGSELHRRPLGRKAVGKILLAATLVAGGLHGSVFPAESVHPLQGLFCNAENQIDEALAYMSRNLAPRTAVELTNKDGVVCTWVDLLQYMVTDAVVIGEIPGSVPLIKYQAVLVGVIVGGEIRPVDPAVRVFFATPARLEGASRESRA